MLIIDKKKSCIKVDKKLYKVFESGSTPILHFTNIVLARNDPYPYSPFLTEVHCWDTQFLPKANVFLSFIFPFHQPLYLYAFVSHHPLKTNTRMILHLENWRENMGTRRAPEIVY